MDNIKLGTQDIELRDGTHVDMPVGMTKYFAQLVEVLAKNKDQIAFKVPRDKLPDTVRSKVGMLKLLDTGAYIEGIGIKSADGAFIIDEYVMPNIVSTEVAK